MCVYVYLVTDLQAQCKDQGNVGVAGARLVPLRASVCTEPWWSRWGWRYVGQQLKKTHCYYKTSSSHRQMFTTYCLLYLGWIANCVNLVSRSPCRCSDDYRGVSRSSETNILPHLERQGPVWDRQGRGGRHQPCHLPRDVQAIERSLLLHWASSI